MPALRVQIPQVFMQLAAAALPSSLRTAGEMHNALRDKKYLVSTRLRNRDENKPEEQPTES